MIRWLTTKRFPLFRFLLYAFLFSSLLVSTAWGEDGLPSGYTTLLDWDESRQGFSFEYRGPANSKMDFFIADRDEESVIHAFDAPGVIDMGSIPLGRIESAPEEGYKNTVRPLQGHSYVLRSKGIYAKIYLHEIFSASDYPNRTVTEYEFDWVIQPGGTRNLGGGGNSSASQVDTKKSLGKVLEATASELNWQGTTTTMPWREFESVFWTGMAENRSVTMGIIIHDSEKLAGEDLKLFGESGYGYSPSKFKSYSAFISKTDGKANGIYWGMGKFVLYVNDPISEKHLYEVANVLYSRATSSPVISESGVEKERDGEGEKVEDKTVKITPTADGQVYAYSYRNWNRANRGKWDRMKAGWNPVGGESRAYLKFDVSQLASSGQVILKLYQMKVQHDGGAPLGIYRVTSKWKEGDSTYVSGRQSPTADPGELSWEQQPTYEEEPVIIFRAPSEGLLQIEITPLVRQWQSGVPNHGLMIRPAAYQPSRQNAHIFTSKEWKEPTERPILVGTVDEKVGTQTQSQSSHGDNGTATGDAAVDLDGDGIDGEKTGPVTGTTTSKAQPKNTVTLKHWGGEGSYEEGYDFSEKGIQRYGETGPDRPSLNPDFYYTGSWEGSFPTTVAHDATSPLERVDYGNVGLNSVNTFPAWNDPRFEEGHLKVGHTYGFYTKEGNYVLLKVQNEKEIPREDWHVGALNISWKLLTKNSGTSASGCAYEIGGLWTETSGYCKETLWDIRFEGEKAPKLSATVECANGYRGKWEARNVTWGEKCQLNYQIVQECSVCKGLAKTRVENHRLRFLNNHSAVLTLDNGTEIYLGRPK